MFDKSKWEVINENKDIPGIPGIPGLPTTVNGNSNIQTPSLMSYFK
jgi:hypothetical protein